MGAYVSLGMLHPNRAGHGNAANHLAPLLNEQLRDALAYGSEKPIVTLETANLGSLTVAFDYPFTQQSHLELSVRKRVGRRQYESETKTLARDATRYRIDERGAYKVSVRACGGITETTCSSWSDPLWVSNATVSAPPRLTHEIEAEPRGVARITARWAPADHHETRFEVVDKVTPICIGGIGTTINGGCPGASENTYTVDAANYETTFIDAPGAGKHEIKVRACNSRTCSAWSAPDVFTN